MNKGRRIYRSAGKNLQDNIEHCASTINQQIHVYNFHLERSKTLKTIPTCVYLFRSSSGSFVVPC